MGKTIDSGRRRYANSVNKYLKSVDERWCPHQGAVVKSEPLPARVRTRVKKEYAQVCRSLGLEYLGVPRTRLARFGSQPVETPIVSRCYRALNDDLRGALARALWLVEEAIEATGQSPTTCESLAAIRNRIAEELPDDWDFRSTTPKQRA